MKVKVYASEHECKKPVRDRKVVEVELNDDLGSAMSTFRPGWTGTNLRAFEDAQFCGVKSGHFARTNGMPGRLLRKEADKRGLRDLR